MDQIHKICVDKTSCKRQNTENDKETKETSTPNTSTREQLQIDKIHEICVDKTSCKRQNAEADKVIMDTTTPTKKND